MRHLNASSISKNDMAPKDEFKCIDIHSFEKIGLIISIKSSWSSLVIIPALIKSSKETSEQDRLELIADVVFSSNKSILNVHFDIEYVNGQRGQRIIHVYTPFWIVSGGFLSIYDLEFQHDLKLTQNQLLSLMVPMSWRQIRYCYLSVNRSKPITE